MMIWKKVNKTAFNNALKKYNAVERIYSADPTDNEHVFFYAKSDNELIARKHRSKKLYYLFPRSTGAEDLIREIELGLK